MNGIMIVLTLLSGVALFLYGMSLMGDGLKRVAGNQLELVLYKLTNTPIKGVLLGTIVTAIIQSSSATTVMVVGFVNSGMMKVAQAIEKLADKYDLKLSDDDKQKLLGLMKKLQGLDLNWDSIKNQASAWASQLQNQLADKNIGQKIAAFFEKLFDMIRSLFQK